MYKALRYFIKTKNIDESYDLKNCTLVFDAKCIFNGDTYKNSLCQFIYGTECDRYADFLKKKLSWLTECGITSYFVFNGGMHLDLESRKCMHENTIQNHLQIDLDNLDNSFYVPILSKNVHLEVLDELGLKYYFTEYDSQEAIISLAKKLRVPVVTNRIDYCFFEVSCISPKSIAYQPGQKIATCRIYPHRVLARTIGVNVSHIPLLMAVLNEDAEYSEYLPRSILGLCRNVPNSLMHWVRRKSTDDAKKYALSYLRSDSDRHKFLDCYKDNETVLQGANNHVVKHFLRQKRFHFIKDGDWFRSGVANCKIALPYINLTLNGILSGCCLVPDIRKDDALLAAIDIIRFVHCLLTSSQNSVITFTGRKNDKCCIWNMEHTRDTTISSNLIFENSNKIQNESSKKPHFNISNALYNCLHETLSGLDYEPLMSLREDSWILIISLVYYMKRCNKAFSIGSYCVVLSYVMLGYVSEAIGIIKRSNFQVSHNVSESVDNKNGLAYQDCRAAAHTFMDLFYIQDLKKRYDPSILYEFAQFQHCLQHLNFLNKLSGGNVKCTIYNKTINATFIYNLHFTVKDMENPLEYLKNALGRSTVTLIFLDILDALEKCLKSVGVDSVLDKSLSTYVAAIDISK